MSSIDGGTPPESPVDSGAPAVGDPQLAFPDGRRADFGGPLVQVRDLRTYFPRGKGWAGRRQWIRALDGVDLTVGRGEIVGVVGESGCGKTTLGRSILHLTRPTGGQVLFDGVDVAELTGAELRSLRRRMQVIFQDPYSSLSPRMQIGAILAEPLRHHRIVPRDAMRARVLSLLEKVGLEPYFATRYPHEMSGGQRQRIAIARALALEPEFIVADEPVSALDVSVRAEILKILLDLRRTEGIAILFISHDLAVVDRMADRTVVMYAGRIVERGPTARLVDNPLHPYTKALLAAVPSGDPGQRRNRSRGTPGAEGAAETSSTTMTWDPGCAFAPRCPLATDRCRTSPPLLGPPGDEGRRVACFEARP